jgi:predicted P-loop ATPase
MDSTSVNQQFFRDLGFPTFPLAGKTPLVKAWQMLTLDTCQPIAPGNYGIVLPADVLVVDADPRNYKTNDDGQKDNPLYRLARAVGGFTPTLSVFTGNGGNHKYFKIPPMPVVPKQAMYPGLDFLSKGRFVVGPGSIHPETKMEYVFSDNCRDISGAAQDLITLVASRGETPRDLSPDDFPNDPASINKYKQELLGFPIAIQGENGDAQTYKAAVLGHNLGLLPETALECLLEVYNPRCLPPWDDVELESKVDNAYKYARQAAGTLHVNPPFSEQDQNLFEAVQREQHNYSPDAPLYLTATNRVESHVGNVDYFLTTPIDRPTFKNRVHRLFKWNELTEEPVYAFTPPWASQFEDKSNKPYTDADVTSFKLWLKRETLTNFKTDDIHEGIKHAAKKYPYNPVKRYLRSLVWDKTPRLATWLHEHCGAEDTEFNALVGEVIFLAAVARAYEPGCKWQHLPILEGDQGARKSDFIELMAKAPEQYASLSLTLERDEKELYMKMRGKWIMEVAEMTGHEKSDVNLVKKFLSDKSGRIRNPYGRQAEDMKKTGIMIATYNPGADGYLRDLSGNRRFLPITIVRMPVDNDAVELIDHLYAEAMHLYKQGRYGAFPFTEMEILGVERTGQATMVDPWVEDISKWVKVRETEFTARDIATQCLSLDMIAATQKQMARIRSALQYLKIPHRQKLVDGVPTRFYDTSGEAYPGDLGKQFKAALASLPYGVSLFQDFVVDRMGAEPTIKNMQQVGMWLRKEGHETRRVKKDNTRVTVIEHKDKGL